MVHVTWGLIIACGKGEQLTPEVDIPFLNLGSRPVLTYSLAAFEQCPEVSVVVVVADKTRIESVLGMTQLFGFSKVKKIVPGGSQRSVSVMNGLRAMDEEVSIVAIHDASRPGITVNLLGETIRAAKRYGSGVTAVEIGDAVKEVAKGLTVSESLKDKSLWCVQTPQTFRRDMLQKAYETARKKMPSVEDDSCAVELIGEEVHLVPSPIPNVRIRKAEDFNLLGALLRV